VGTGTRRPGRHERWSVGTVTPLVDDRRMTADVNRAERPRTNWRRIVTTPEGHQEIHGPGPFRCDANAYDVVVEEWWCPVCGGAAHRTYRPGRPKIYCSNACRQRAYRWRRRNCARTVARPGARAEGAYVVSGTWHALRAPHDLPAGRRDRRGRQVTVCGALARPARLLGTRTHYDFVDHIGQGCRTCTALVAPTLDPRAPCSDDLGGAPEPRAEHLRQLLERHASRRRHHPK
jgi:hypothetical protein